MPAVAGKPVVSACLIVRDEERFLDGCLGSIVDQVDEIVVVDTGSTDRTIAIARSFGARIFEIEWRDDFSAARNFGLDSATGGWILYIDADERVAVPAGTRLSDGLDRVDIVAARPLFRPRLEGTPYREYRLFRNDPRIRFRGTIHETIRPDIHEVARLETAAIIDVPTLITHLGYQGDQAHKHARNLPLLRRAVAADPARVYYWHHLAETLDGIGAQAEAIATCRQGMAMARGHRDPAQDAVTANLAVTFARLLLRAGDDAMAVIDEALDTYPGHKALLFLKARALVDRGEPRPALAILENLTGVDADNFVDPRVSYDRRIFGAFAHDLAGLALLRLGECRAAAAAFARAAAAEPGDPTYRRKAEALGFEAAN